MCLPVHSSVSVMPVLAPSSASGAQTYPKGMSCAEKNDPPATHPVNVAIAVSRGGLVQPACSDTQPRPLQLKWHKLGNA
ncbi:hypothetical protein BaRGS_00014759 [Batillaria attramentaria]|uniref:Ig-like domain-containing protein n=1 Tax=Batillaria attramentaria TaxID=370345 RepID=A0ABD0L390_9CAEN